MIRNNNPGNIRRVQGNPWNGEVVPSPWVPGFVVFDTVESGYRAMLLLLNSYINKGYNTIAKIITRWAPPTENNTLEYVFFVVGYTGTPADKEIEVDGIEIWEVAAAMSEYEHSGELTPTDLNALTTAYNKLTGYPGGSQLAGLEGVLAILGILFVSGSILSARYHK